jgi:hypothetical protein
VFVESEINEPGNRDGSTLLLEAAGRRSFSKEVLSLLLQKGADIRARTMDGSTCLHLCLKHLIGDSAIQPGFGKGMEEQQILMHLIEQGADIRARDNRGRTVSDVAYASRTIDWWPPAFPEGMAGSKTLMGCVRVDSSYVGDLWDSVLAAHGHDLDEFRRGRPRRPGFGGAYTRREFELLWAGREETCPYWDDAPYPPGEDVGQGADATGSAQAEDWDAEDDPW